MKCLVTMDNIRDLRESDNRQLGQTILAREGYPWLIKRAERMDKKYFYRKKWYLGRAAKDKLTLLSLLKWESLL